jgi:hypothetical protein
MPDRSNGDDPGTGALPKERFRGSRGVSGWNGRWSTWRAAWPGGPRDNGGQRLGRESQGTCACTRSATIAVSSIGDSTELRRSFGPIGRSSTDCRDRT